MKKLIVLTIALTIVTPTIANADEILTPTVAHAEDSNEGKTVRIWPLPLDIKTISMGSGFFVEDGRIITNDHVLRDATSFLIKDGAGHEYTASIVAKDHANDLAILETNETNHPYFELGNQVSSGQNVSFIGSDLMDAYKQWDTVVTQASAFVSVGTEYNGERMLMAKDGMHGYSGGPVINEDDKIVAVMEAGSDGMGSAAVPVDDLKRLIDANPAPEVVKTFKSRLEQIRDRFKGVLNHDNACE